MVIAKDKTLYNFTHLELQKLKSPFDSNCKNQNTDILRPILESSSVLATQSKFKSKHQECAKFKMKYRSIFKCLRLDARLYKTLFTLKKRILWLYRAI